MISETGVERASRPAATTCGAWRKGSGISLRHMQQKSPFAHPESQILCGEDACKVLILVDDQNAIGPFRRTKLTCIRDGDGLRDCQGWQRSKSRDCTWSSNGNRARWCLLLAPAVSGVGRGRLARLALQFELYLLANGLGGGEGSQRMVRSSLAWSAAYVDPDELTSSRLFCRFLVSIASEFMLRLD